MLESERRKGRVDSHDVASRVASLETSFDALVSDIKRVEKGQEELAGQIGRMRDSISRELTGISERLSDTQRTPWAVILQAGILVVILAAATLTPVWITTKNINDKAQTALDWQ